jgi:hypothetical protein
MMRCQVFLGYTYQRLEPKGDSPDSTPKGDKTSLPLREIPPSAPLVEAAKPPIPPPVVQQNITTELPGGTTEDNTAKRKKPLLVKVVEDDEHSSFETKSVAFGRWGIGIAIVTILIGIGTARVFWGQFKEMSAQTDILAISARQARRDSAESSLNAVKQLAIAQQQASAAQESVKAIQAQIRQDHRAWIKIPAPSASPAISIDGGEDKVFAELTMVNVGRAPARDVNLKVVIQLVKDGEAPTFSYKHGWGAVYGLLYPDEPAPPIHVTMMDAQKNDAILKDTELNDLISGASYIAVYAKVTYVDIFGIHHWTHSCTWKGLRPGKEPDTRKCTSYNRVDQNQ